MEFLTKINDPVLLALASTCFTWFMTALGAGMVFFFKEINKRVLNMMLGFAAGIMVAASFWSLLEPAIEMAQSAPIPAWLVAAIGFVGGAGFLCLADHVMPHAHFFAKEGQTEGIPTHLKRSILLAMAVALGIGLQNFPEGAAVSIPLRREGMSRFKSFMYGQASGVVEPMAGVLGAWAVAGMTPVLPYALAFAAGAMLYVVVEELIPEAQSGGEHESADLSTIGFIVGFTIMMIMDVALG